MHSFTSAGREAENFLGMFQMRSPCLRGLLCHRDSRLDSLTPSFPPPLQWESLSDASERTQQTHCFSQRVMSIAQFLFSPGNTWFWSFHSRWNVCGSVFKRLVHKISGLNSALGRLLSSKHHSSVETFPTYGTVKVSSPDSLLVVSPVKDFSDPSLIFTFL